MPGTLHIVSTPIGNLEDISYRAIRVLGEATLIAAEDTRRTTKLLHHYHISTPTTSFHEHNEHQKTRHLVARLIAADSIALVSDAGTPLLSDPGARLVRAAIAAGIRVEPVPGPSAILAALVISGLTKGSFTFVGFPPSRSYNRKQWLSALVSEPRPVIMFEAPHRILATLTDMLDVLGDRPVSVCRELTKMHESLVVGPISSVIPCISAPRGEFTIVVEGLINQQKEQTPALTGKEAYEELGHLTDTGVGRRVGLRALAKKYGLSTRRLYELVEQGKP